MRSSRAPHRAAAHLASLAFASACLYQVATPAPAHAAHRRVAVLRLAFPEDMPDNNKNFLRERLIGGLAAAEFQVFAGMTVEQLLKQGSRLESCSAPACYREIAQRLGVEYLVTGAVQVDKKNYDVIIEIISGRDGKGIGQSMERCELCGIKEVGTQMDRQVLSLRGKAEEAAATAPGRFAIESRPQGAEVAIDGKPAGVTPLSVDVATGTHRMTVRSPGFQVSERNIFVDNGMNGYLAVDLTPLGTAGSASGGVWRPTRLTAVTLALVGAAALGAAAITYHFHNSIVTCKQLVRVGDRDECGIYELRQTALESGILYGAGGLLLLGGSTLFFLTPKDAAREPANGHRAWIAGAQGTF
jgi:TolB-like protein